MPHALATTNGRTAMAYFGETPWHRLGTRLNEPATATEAIDAAGLDYQVELHPLQTQKRWIDVPQRKAVVRTDTNDVLGVVGNSYQPIQNHQCFGFLDSVVADGHLRYHTAGALGQGERVWMLAKFPGEIRVKDSDDVTEKFLLLHNSHDGTSALRVFFSPIRVVCANTLAMAERRSHGQGISIAHKGDLQSKIAEAQEILGFAKQFYDDAEEKINRLASFSPTRQQLDQYFRTIYPDREEGSNHRARKTRANLFHLFEHGRGQNIPETRFTAWSAFNAVTEYVDHHRSTRGHSQHQRDSTRLKSSWFGSGARLKADAWQGALELLP